MMKTTTLALIMFAHSIAFGLNTMSLNNDQIKSDMEVFSEFDFSFLYINVEMINGRASIAWKAANEYGGSYVVEKTSDGIDFKKVRFNKLEKSIKASNQEDYVVIDKNPIDGISYYRIRYIDVKKRSWTSSLIPIKN